MVHGFFAGGAYLHIRMPPAGTWETLGVPPGDKMATAVDLSFTTNISTTNKTAMANLPPMLSDIRSELSSLHSLRRSWYIL